MAEGVLLKNEKMACIAIDTLKKDIDGVHICSKVQSHKKNKRIWAMHGRDVFVEQVCSMLESNENIIEVIEALQKFILKEKTPSFVLLAYTISNELYVDSLYSSMAAKPIEMERYETAASQVIGPYAEYGAPRPIHIKDMKKNTMIELALQNIEVAKGMDAKKYLNNERTVGGVIHAIMLDKSGKIKAYQR